MKKKMLIIIVVSIALCISYIAIRKVDIDRPNEVSRLYNKIDSQNIVFDKIGIELSGIQKSELLSQEDLQKMNDELVNSLAIRDITNQGAERIHTTYRSEKNFNEVKTFNDTQEIQYNFNIKNQKDISYNTYCRLTITGNEISKLDQLTSEGKSKVKSWISDIHESIYFIGHIEGKISDEEGRKFANQIFKAFSAKYKDYYEDDLNESTYVYYGYTSYFNEFIREKGNMKINIQVGFKYNDEVNQTEMIIAFPFYNLPF